MNWNRRSFLASAIAAATLDPERLLWRAGAKTISVPKSATKRIVMVDGALFHDVRDENGNLVAARSFLVVPVNGLRILEPRLISSQNHLDTRDLSAADVNLISRVHRKFFGPWPYSEAMSA